MSKPGLFWGFISYVMWGFFPLYWKLLKERPALEVLSHRIVWSFVFYLVIVLFFARRDLLAFFKQTRRDWLLSTLSAFFLAINWGVYIYAVNSGHILEGSLAYFICPILNVVIGVLFFKEAFPTVLKVSVAAIAVGVLIRIALAPTFPWLALIIASSFSFYGITKKLLKIPVMTSSLMEGTIGLAPAIAAAYYFSSASTLPPLTGHLWILLIAGGIVTGLPLFLFSFAAQKIPFSIVGMLQYIVPLIQFALAVWIYDEAFGTNDFIAFGFIWLGMALYLGNLLYRLRQPKITPAPL